MATASEGSKPWNVIGVGRNWCISEQRSYTTVAKRAAWMIDTLTPFKWQGSGRSRRCPPRYGAKIETTKGGIKTQSQAYVGSWYS